MSSSFMMFWMTLFSELSITPSSSPMFAIADTSSREMEVSGSSPATRRRIFSTSQTMGYRRTIRPFMMRASQVRFFQ